MNQEDKANKNDEEPGSLSVGNGPSKNISVTSGDALDLSKYDVVAIPIDPERAKATLDSLVPLAGAAADAAGQWNQVLVRFPKGYGWKDTTFRKTPGYKGWKQAGIYKGKGYKGQTAIKQAKLQPAAVANLALQGAAIVVGQAYMTEINEQLGGIQEGVTAIQRDMRAEREAKLEAQLEKLREYVSCYSEIDANPERRQAVLNGIENISVGALEAWKFQVRSLELLGDSLHGGFVDNRTVVSKVDEFRVRDREAAAAYVLCAAAEQVAMQYSQDFSPERLERERDRADRRLEEYAKARSAVQASLNERVNHMVGNIAAIPDEVDDGYERQNPIFDTVHDAAALANRLTPLAVIGEGRRRTKLRKRSLHEAVSEESSVKDAADAEMAAIDRMDFAYNKADAILVDGKGVRFLREKGEDDKKHDA